MRKVYDMRYLTERYSAVSDLQKLMREAIALINEGWEPLGGIVWATVDNETSCGITVIKYENVISTTPDGV